MCFCSYFNMSTTKQSWCVTTTHSVVSCETSWTPILVIACDQTLLWVIGDIGAENGVHQTNEPIGTYHLNTLLPGSLEGLQKCPHTVMENLVTLVLPL